jgi:hypothetical protein
MKILNLIFIFSFLNLFGQETNFKQEDLKAIVSEIKKKDILVWKLENGKNAYFNDSLYNKLKEFSTEKQILDFTKDDNGILKIYSFRVLCEKYPNKCFEVINDNLHNYTTFKNRNGCVVVNDYVTDFWIFYVTSKGWQSNFKVSEEQIKELNNALISDKSIKLRSRFYALREIQTNEENYNLIKSLVLKEESGIALYLLAEYRKQEDIELISTFYNRKGYLDSFLKAVENFPDESFYKYILLAIENEKKENVYYENSNWDRILITLAKYPSIETKGIFEELLEKNSNEKYSSMSRGILLAITKNPNPIFESLKPKIEVREYEMEEINNQISFYNSK